MNFFGFLNSRLEEKESQIDRMADLVYLLSKKIAQFRKMKAVENDRVHSEKSSLMIKELHSKITQLEKTNSVILRDNMSFENENNIILKELEALRQEKDSQLDRM